MWDTRLSLIRTYTVTDFRELTNARGAKHDWLTYNRHECPCIRRDLRRKDPSIVAWHTDRDSSSDLCSRRVIRTRAIASHTRIVIKAGVPEVRVVLKATLQSTKELSNEIPFEKTKMKSREPGFCTKLNTVIFNLCLLQTSTNYCYWLFLRVRKPGKPAKFASNPYVYIGDTHTWRGSATRQRTPQIRHFGASSGC